MSSVRGFTDKQDWRIQITDVGASRKGYLPEAPLTPPALSRSMPRRGHDRRRPLGRPAARRGWRLVRQGRVDQAYSGVPLGRDSLPGGVPPVPRLPAQARRRVRHGESRRLVQELPRGNGVAEQPPVRDAPDLRRGCRRPRADPRAPDRPDRVRRALPEPELRPREPVDELRPARLPRAPGDVHDHLLLRAGGPHLGTRRRDPLQEREAMVSPADVTERGAPQRGSAIATPQGRVPQGIRATTLFEAVSITASSLARPTVA